MKKKLYLAAAALLALLTAGCQLAQPGRGGGDRFAGYMLAYEYNEMGAGKWSDYPWTTYEGELAERDPFGTASKEGLIVTGTWNEEEFRYDFPGVKGVGCFLTLVPGADWIAVQEFYGDEAGKKTLYSLDDRQEDGSLVHSMVLLDEAGMGFYGNLTLR